MCTVIPHIMILLGRSMQDIPSSMRRRHMIHSIFLTGKVLVFPSRDDVKGREIIVFSGDRAEATGVVEGEGDDLFLFGMLGGGAVGG